MRPNLHYEAIGLPQRVAWLLHDAFTAPGHVVSVRKTSADWLNPCISCTRLYSVVGDSNSMHFEDANTGRVQYVVCKSNDGTSTKYILETCNLETCNKPGDLRFEVRPCDRDRSSSSFLTIHCGPTAMLDLLAEQEHRETMSFISDSKQMLCNLCHRF